jgi:putative ABC transport system permease protein
MTIDLDLRAALRSLVRSPGFLAAAVLSLALGIGAGAAAFGVIDAVRLRALPFKNGDRLVVLREVPAGPAGSGCRTTCDVAYETYAGLLRVHPPRTLDAVAGYTSGGKALATGNDQILVVGGVVSPSLFDLLGARPVLGRTLTPDDDRLGAPPVVVLSHDLWVNQLGSDPGILGKTVKLSDTHYTVIGVMPKGFEYESRSRFWLPVVPVLDPSTRPSIRSLMVIGRLAPGRTLAELRGELATIDPTALTQTGPGGKVTIRLDASPLRERYTSSTQSHDLIFAAIVAFVLLIACANVANLALVRALYQQREFALRTALGARPGRLARGLLAQHGLLVLFAAALGLVFAAWFLGVLQSLEALQSLRPSGMEYRLDGRVIAFALVLAVAIGGLLGGISARAVTRSNVQGLLREGAPSASVGRRGSRVQQGFVVAQIASAVALLAGAGLLAKTAYRLSRLDPGFDAALVLQGSPSFPHPWRVREKYLPVTRQIQAELGQLPGAGSVTLRAEVPLGPRGAAPMVTLEGEASPLPRGMAPETALSVGPGYFRTLGIAMVQGREFSEQDLETTPAVAVVNQWAARHWWPSRDAIGRTIRIDTAPGAGVTMTVVGVARDNKAAGRSLLLSEDGPELYRPYEQASSAFPTFFVRAASGPAPLLRPMREILVRLVPDRPVFAALLSENVNDQLSGVRLNALQVMAFALVGLFLALLGIHGVLSYAVGRRTQEIGIRGALGATRGGIERMVLGDALRLTALGVVLGLPVAVLVTKPIRGMLYGTSPTDPVVYGAVALAVGVVSVVAGYAPARRAARVDPVIALRAG